MEPFDPLRFRLEPKFTGPEAAERAGVPVEYAKRIFRALGFPDVPDEEVQFDERDVEVLSGLRSIVSSGFSDEEIVQVARTMGFGLSRIAQAEVRLFRKTFIEPLREEGMSDDDIAARVEEIVPDLLQLLNDQVEHVHRRHLALALQQVVAAEIRGGGELLAAGFVDLVDFSRIARNLAGDDLGELVSRFESLALERCVEHGAHVVKMIGDAVMFTAPNAESAVAAALSLVNEATNSEDLPGARAGLDLGEAISVGGDFFGRPVNVAARLTTFARPGTVVASADLVDGLPEPVDTSRIGPQRLKGVGTVDLFKINAYPAEERKRKH